MPFCEVNDPAKASKALGNGQAVKSVQILLYAPSRAEAMFVVRGFVFALLRVLSAEHPLFVPTLYECAACRV